MANQEHLAILKRGVTAWNAWREANPRIKPDLSLADLTMKDLLRANLSEATLIGANLCGADLSEAKLLGANLSGASISRADLSEANFSTANLSAADLFGANIYKTDLSRVNLSGADLSEARIFGADLSGANLSGAELVHSILIGTNIDNAILRECRIYGVSVWDVKGQPAEQKDLLITPSGEPKITVDNLKIAQFIYLLLNNPEIRDVIDTITSKVVLILGRFTEERKVVLDAVRDELRKRDKLPVLFDFTPSQNRNSMETIRTLASMAQFIIADITDPKCVIGELEAIVPHFSSVPVQPIIHVKEVEYGMFDQFKNYPWVLKPYQYDDTQSLLAALGSSVIMPAENKWRELTGHLFAET